MTYIQDLQSWFDESLQASFNRAKPHDLRLFLGCAVWGEKYVRRFLKYGVPSLLAKGNLPYLIESEDTVILTIHTDKDSVKLLRNGLKELANSGVLVEIQEIPEGIIKKTPDEVEFKYRLISAIHNLHMKQAKYLRCSYHMLMPDHVYSENYFKGIKRLAKSNDAIVHGGLSATIEDAGPELESGPHSAKKLNGIGWKYLHDMFTPFIMNGRDVKTDTPTCSYMVFSTKKNVHIESPHHSIAYLSLYALMHCPIRLFNTIDSQLPYIISEKMKVCIPGPEDDMSYIEISDREKPTNPVEPNDILMFCLQFWISTYCQEGYLRYFDMDNTLPLPDDFEHHITPMSKAQADKLKTTVRTEVRKNRALCMRAMDPKYHQDPIPA